MTIPLHTARKIAGLTQTELARRAGVDQQDISDIERGRNRNPGWKTVGRIAQALGVEPHEIFPLPEMPVVPETSDDAGSDDALVD